MTNEDMAFYRKGMEEFNHYYEGVEPMSGRYWDNEAPKIYKIASMELRYFAQAGKLQMYIPNAQGYSGKAIVLTLGDQAPEDLALLMAAFNNIFYDSISEAASTAKWALLLQEQAEEFNAQYGQGGVNNGQKEG